MEYITVEHTVLFAMVCAFVSLLRHILRIVTFGLFAKLEHTLLTGLYSLIATIAIIMHAK